MICNNGKFTLIEQIWMQLSFNGLVLLGAFSIFILDPFISLLYVLFVVAGIFFFIMHLWICPRCPHIKDHASCVQLHPFLAKKIIKKGVSRPLKVCEAIGFYIVLYGILFIPIYWVISTGYLIIPYFLLAIMHYSGYYFHFCPRCLNIDCPQNTNNELKNNNSTVLMNKEMNNDSQ
ncbi:MAG: hypothetical protein MUD12_16670 [Spirochaetes bacterium]|nr:hypothetical protein [Spirochaetota bacterium]